MSIEIIGYGLAQAEKCVTNHELAKTVDTNDAWIQERTGILHRYFSITKNTSDLASEAAMMAIQDAKIDPKTIDLILVATITPDGMMPSTASLVQAKCGLNGQNCLSYDINAACTGFIVAMQNAQAMLEAGFVSNALVIGAETLSKILDFNDRTTSVLFGDGAGAIILRKSTSKQMLHYTRSEGDVNGVLTSDGLALNPEMKFNHLSSHYLRMQGQAVFRFAVKAIEDVIVNVLMQTKLEINQIDWIVPHQANRRIIEYVANKMNIDLSKFYLNLDQYGNTSSASIPIALSEMKTKGVLKEGMRVICVGFGAGLTWGGSYFES